VKYPRAILVAPDKFKSSFSAAEVAAAIGRGLIGGGAGEVALMPISDGGEGTSEALVRALGGRTVPAEATDPLGRPVVAAFGLVQDGRTAVIDVAQASGLWRLDPAERDAWSASSRGTGELIEAALDTGVRELIVAAGGSATTDGGRGALEALGARFLKTKAKLEAVRARLRGVTVLVACDVRNPLLGPDGAARAFAPQKGADHATVERLETRLADWAKLAQTTTGRDPASEPMAGAAGGLAGGFWAFAGAQLKSGAGLVLDVLGFDEQLRNSFAVVTGEGQLDEQTLQGKAVFEVATRCRQAGVPCYAVSAVDALDDFGKRLLNIEVVAAAQSNGQALIEDVERAARLLARRSLRAPGFSG
jgi:glycerate kinase